MPRGKFEFAFDIGIIVYVEMALKWNRITGVHSLSSPGQFMPLFIALAQLIATAYRALKAIHPSSSLQVEPDADEGEFNLKYEYRINRMTDFKLFLADSEPECLHTTASSRGDMDEDLALEPLSKGAISSGLQSV
jgi:hypothetical protein